MPATPPPVGSESPFDVRAVIWKIRREKWLVILPIVFALCVGSVYMLFATPTYESHVIVALADRAEVSSAIEPFVRPDRDQDTPRERVVLVEGKVRSRLFLEELVKRLELDKDPILIGEAAAAARKWPKLTAAQFAVRIAAGRLAKQIRVTPMEGTNVRITVADPEPEDARRLASMIADILIEESRRTNLERVQARGEFSADQLRIYEERLRDSEKALALYQERALRSGLMRNPVDKNDADIARSLVSVTDQEIGQITNRLDAEREDWAREAGTDTPLPTLRSSRTEELERGLTNLEHSCGAAALRGDRGERDLANLQANVGVVRQELFNEFESLAADRPDLPSGALRGIAAGVALDRAIVRTLTAKRDRIAGFLRDFERGIEAAPREEMELARLKAEVQTNRDFLDAIRRESVSSRLSAALEVSNLGLRLSVVDPPQLPLKPTEPNPVKILGGALLLGPVLAGGLIVAGERLGVVVRTVEQAEAELGTAVLGTVPRIEGWPRPGSYLQNHWAPIAVGLILLLTGSAYVLHATVLSAPPAAESSAGPHP